MGNILLKNLDIDEKTQEIGTKEFDTLWTQYSTDNTITRERAVKFIKKLASVVGLDYDTQQSETLLCRLERDHGGGGEGGFNDAQFRRIFFNVADDSGLTLTVSLKKRKPIFGHPWEEELCSKYMRTLMVHVLKKMIKFLEENEVFETEGIFRIPGHGEKMEELALSLNKNPMDLVIDPVYYSVHDVGGTLKLFFRQMPTPLVPYYLYDDIVEVSRETENPKSRSMLIKNIISKLPQFNALLLEILVKFLNLIHQNEKMTQMPATNLATCFTPTLVRAKSEDPMAILMDHQHLRIFIVDLISHPFYYFDHGHIFFVRSDSGKTRASPLEKSRIPTTPTKLPILDVEDSNSVKSSQKTRNRGVSSSESLTNSSPESPSYKKINNKHFKAKSTDDIPNLENSTISQLAYQNIEKAYGLKVGGDKSKQSKQSPRKSPVLSQSEHTPRGSKLVREFKKKHKEEGTEDLKNCNLRENGTELKERNLDEEGNHTLNESILKEGNDNLKENNLKEEGNHNIKETNLKEGTEDLNTETSQDL